MRPAAAVAVLSLHAAACSLLVDKEVAGGIGTACTENTDCQASSCTNGLCSVSCGSDAECPSPSRCLGDQCQIPMNVGALHVGAITDTEGWTLTHHEGLVEATGGLAYATLLPEEQFVGPPDVGARVDALIEDGAGVIFATSFNHRAGMIEQALEHPEVSFLTCSGNVTNGVNHGSYFGRMEQAWYVAGKVAARKATDRLGVVGSYITPEVVRHINAFALGARSEKPTMLVEVRWLGFWFDYNTSKTFPDPYDSTGVAKLYGEEYHTAMLMQSGCEVIAHQVDDGRPVRYLELRADPARVSLANDNRYGCHVNNDPEGAPIASCLGSVYWNWTPMYRRLLEDIHRRVWDPSAIINENIASDPDASIVGFARNAAATLDLEDQVIQQWVAEVAQDPVHAFKGPYDTTGQRDPMPAGVSPTDAELASMCWFVANVVEKEDATDPTSADRPAQVPVGGAMPALTLTPLGAAAGEGWSCTQNQ